MLSKRIMQYASLLQTAADVIRNSIPDGDLQRLGLQVLRDSEEALGETHYVLERYGTKAGAQRRTKAVILAMKWSSDRKQIFAIMDQVESLKSTLTIMLQTHHPDDRTKLRGHEVATEQALVSHQR